MDVQTLAAEIDRALRALGTAERRRVAAGYFPSAMEHLGVAVPALRKVVRAHAKTLRPATPTAVLRLARALIATKSFDGRNAAYELLSRHTGAMAALDERTLNALGRGNDNWCSVDTFATLLAGPCWREGRIDDEVVRRWAASEDRWWRRTALVATVPLNRGPRSDLARTLDIARRLVGDRDDMVVKAMSWALRSLAIHDPDAVRAFMAQHEVAARVRREVTRKIETGRKSG